MARPDSAWGISPKRRAGPDVIVCLGHFSPGGFMNALLIEEGAALQALDPVAGAREAEALDVAVIGAGQAGLSAGYHLSKRGVRFAILEGGERVGDAWRKRWDSLRLFTPAAYDGLDGLPFPAPADSFPTKDEMADYLEAYVAKFQLPVRTRQRVDRVSREGDMYEVRAGAQRYRARAVIVAMGTYQQPRVPDFARQLDPRVVQLAASAYKRPSQLGEGDVLLVGAGNSGAEIAKDLSSTGRRVYLSGRSVGEVPFKMESWLGRKVLSRLVLGFAFNHVLTVKTPPGKKARHAVLTRGGMLIRVREGDLARLGVERVARVAGVTGGKPVLDDGRVLDVGNVVWCTGYHGGYEWIDLPIFNERGEPRHERGVVTGEPGLYFLGLHFQYAMSSGMIHGVGRDARFVVERIAQRVPALR
jgi:putative flavoprotein involved in K+ transport